MDFRKGKKGALLDGLLDDVADVAEDAFYSLSPRDRRDEDSIEAKVAAKVKRLIRDQTGKRTLVEVVAHKVK